MTSTTRITPDEEQGFRDSEGERANVSERETARSFEEPVRLGERETNSVQKSGVLIVNALSVKRGVLLEPGGWGLERGY